MMLTSSKRDALNRSTNRKRTNRNISLGEIIKKGLITQMGIKETEDFNFQCTKKDALMLLVASIFADMLIDHIEPNRYEHPDGKYEDIRACILSAREKLLKSIEDQIS